MTLVWSLEHLWFERLAASGSVLFHHCMACARRIVHLCPTLQWCLENDLDMAFGASLVWTSCSVRKRLDSSLYGMRAHCASLPYFALKPKEWPWYGFWSIFGLNVLQHPEASCFIILWRAHALCVFALLCIELRVRRKPKIKPAFEWSVKRLTLSVFKHLGASCILGSYGGRLRGLSFLKVI